MARNLTDRDNAPTPDEDYPLSKIIDISGPGNEDGSKVEEAIGGDKHVTLQKLMGITDITPNELPDNESNGYQLLIALMRSFRAVKTKYWITTAHQEANNWTGIAYGNGLIVCVSLNGTNRVSLSSDFGRTWTARSASEANQWAKVSYGSGLFVAVSIDGTNRVMTSPDGVTWTSRSAAEANQWQSITFDGTNFVAVSADGTNRVMTSPDGITWTARAASEANDWRGVYFGAGVFVAVSADGTNRVMRSTDNGQNWSSVSVPSEAWRTVIYGNGVFVAAGENGALMYSEDLGLTWTDITGEVDATLDAFDIGFGGGIFFLCGINGTISDYWESVDGRNWWADTTRPNMERGVYANGAFVFCGDALVAHRGV